MFKITIFIDLITSKVIRNKVFWGQEPISFDYSHVERISEKFDFLNIEATDSMGSQNSRTVGAIKPIFNRKHVAMILEISAKFHPDLSSFA